MMDEEKDSQYEIAALLEEIYRNRIENLKEMNRKRNRELFKFSKLLLESYFD